MFGWVPNAPFIKFKMEKRNKKMNKTKEDAEQKMKNQKIKSKLFEFSFDFKSRVKKGI